MLGTPSLSNYFNNNTAQALPVVSAEWNYNLIYNTYVTFTGNGNNLMPKYGYADWKSTGNEKLQIEPGQDAYTTSVFKDTSSVLFGVQPYVYPTSDQTDYSAGAKISVSVPSGANCYKIVYYARSLTSDTINVSTNVSTSTTNLEATSFTSVDNFNWQKVTVYAGVKPTDKAYGQFDLEIDFTNTTMNSTLPWGLEICHVEVYQITYFDYCYHNMWPSDSIFTYFRPGESYVTSGNSLVPKVVRTISSTKSGFNSAMPISPVVYSPRTLFSANANSAYKNGALSPLSSYKYFVSEVPSGATSVGAAYEEVLNSNKIIIKFNLSQSVPDGFTISLYNGSSAVGTPTTFHSSDIQDSGLFEAYWNGAVWTTTKWAWTNDASSQMPTINSSGQISKSQGFNKIVVTQNHSTINPQYGSASADAKSEFTRMQVVEISPRLELDLSSFITEVDTQKLLDGKNTPLPISSMTANTATILLSNIPMVGPNNQPMSIFSTNANDPAYKTPLTNMIVKNVKFYVSYYVTDSSVDTAANRLIPGGVFYVDTWDNTDLKNAKANCLDVVKFLQTVQVNDYVSYEQGLVEIFTNIMDFSGFTDYNIDELSAVLSANNQDLVVGYFFADGVNKTVYDVLHEAFMAYQIGAWVDEFGVLRFMNLKNILSNNKSSLDINDNSIIVDTYNENIKAKTGKLRMLYREPQRKFSVWTSPLALENTNSTILRQAPDVIWKQDTEDLVPFNYLYEPITSASQNYYRVDPNSLTDLFYTTVFDHNGYMIVEGEIISSGDKEWQLTDLDPNHGLTTDLIHISNQSDYTAKVANFTSKLGSTTIGQAPTGRFVNIQRGLFGTAAKPHIPLTKNVSSRLECYTWDLNEGFSKTTPFSVSSSNNLIQVPIQSNGFPAIIAPLNEYDQGYSTYSTRFRFLPYIAGSYVRAGLKTNITSRSNVNDDSFYAVIEAGKPDKNGQSKYSLHYGVTDINGISKTIDITGIMNSYFQNEPSLPLYASKEKGMINLKITGAPVLQYTIDPTTNKKILSLDSNGNVQYVNKIIIYINNTKFITDFDPAPYLGVKGTTFFGYAYGDGSAATTVEFAELYACESSLDEKVRYHFQSQTFLDNLVAGKSSAENFYMMQSQPQLIGLNVYDVQLSVTPSAGAEYQPVMYSLNYQDPTNSQAPTELISVTKNALSYSNIASTGFRAKFAVANNSPFSVWTQTGTQDTQAVQSQFFIMSRNMIVLTDQITLERVLNPQNVLEVVEIQSDWVQSKQSADSILKVLADATDAFSKDIQIDIFGNPLIQVGDVITLTYGLKNIKSLTFFVQSVSQTFKTGLKTQLVLNQIGYTGTGTASKQATFPLPNAIATSQGNIALSPNFGSVTGGDTITIVTTDSNSFTPTNLPTVTFGSASAYNITYVSPNTITVATPPKSYPGAVNVSLVLGGRTFTTTKNYYGFTYKSITPQCGDITDLSVYSDVPASPPNDKKDNVALTWTIPENCNAFDYSISNNGTGINSDTRSDKNIPLPFEGFSNLGYNASFDDANFAVGYVGSYLQVTNPGTLGGPLVAGQEYTFTITPKNITGSGSNVVVNSVGKAMTITQYIGSSSNIAPLPFTIVSPSVQELDVSGFSFAGALSYKIDISTPSSADIVQNIGTITDATTTYKFSGLIAGAAYKITVSAFGQASQSGPLLAVGIKTGVIPDGTNKSSTGGQSLPPATPTVITTGTVPYTTNSDGTVSFSITVQQDTTNNAPTSYNVTVSPGNLGQANITFPFVVSNLTLSGGNYVLSMPATFPTGNNYTLTVSAQNSNGTSQPSNPYVTGLINPIATSNNPVATNLVISGNMNVSWTGNTSFTNYNVTYSGGTKPPISYALAERSGFGNANPSGDAITFVDTSYAQNYFNPGDQILVQIQPFTLTSSSSVQAPILSNADNLYTIPAATVTSNGTTFQTPIPNDIPVYAQDYQENSQGLLSTKTGGSFFWFDNPYISGDADYYVYEWKFKVGSGSFGAAQKFGATNINPPSGNDYFLVNTSHTGPCTLQVRQIVTGNDGRTYNGNVTTITATFT